MAKIFQKDFASGLSRRPWSINGHWQVYGSQEAALNRLSSSQSLLRTRPRAAQIVSQISGIAMVGKVLMLVAEQLFGRLEPER
ncbi:hypothetical protein CK226_16700 [Mesorhizobium sp. WSM4311]|nr:hypothetical protein CK226_16700 [Mesorhizobium sp. WSM4311]